MHNVQKTVAKPLLIEGIGLHSGEHVSMTIFPAEANQGIRFVRVDLNDNPSVTADPFNVVDTSRSTKLGNDDATVQTVEHLMAAFAYTGIDNALIEIDGVEVPILDGSALPFVEQLEKTGKKDLGEPRKVYTLEKTIEFRDEERDIHLIATPASEFSVFCMIDYDSKILGKQYAELEKISDFKEKIASSRTFCFFSELEQLAKNDLIKGGSLDNALVVVEDHVSDKDLTHISTLLNKPKVEVTKGFLNNTRPAEKNEPARHKLLDIVGDLNLLNAQVNMRIIAKRPGHYANTELSKLIKKQIIEQEKAAAIPVYDPTEEALLSVEEIKELLPHRYPFLMVDKVISMTDEEIVGLKNITANEELFQGHFPGNPVFPGVLQVEALAQCGGILALKLQEDPHGWDTYFLKIDNCKFKRMVFPGDTLLLKMKFTQPIRRGICVMKGEAYVGKHLVAEADLVAKIQKR